MHTLRRRFLDPLSNVERLHVANRIRAEVANVAADVLQAEQEAKAQLNSEHIKCISLMTVAAVAVGATTVYLQIVLVPFVLAIFFLFLLEPVLFVLLDVPRFFGSRLCMESSRRPGEEEVHQSCGPSGRVMLNNFSNKVWFLFSVLVCMLLLLVVSGSVMYFLIDAISGFPWQKYSTSVKLKPILEFFPIFGTDPQNLNFETFLPWLLQGPLFDVLSVSLAVVSQIFLTLLFLSFLLAHDEPPRSNEETEFKGVWGKVRTSVRRYIRIKAIMAFAVSAATGTFMWYINVDLFFVFTFLTFILYFIPHVGNTVAVIVPLPLVYVDPMKSWADLAWVFIIPFGVHQLALNLIEPKLLASSLDLHPIVVLVSLAFWMTIWGAMGALLSVPVTAVARLTLIELKHPYATPILWLLKGCGREEGQQQVSMRKDKALRDSPDSPESPKSNSCSETWNPDVTGLSCHSEMGPEAPCLHLRREEPASDNHVVDDSAETVLSMCIL